MSAGSGSTNTMVNSSSAANTVSLLFMGFDSFAVGFLGPLGSCELLGGLLNLLILNKRGCVCTRVCTLQGLDVMTGDEHPSGTRQLRAKVTERDQRGDSVMSWGCL
jgi:hypothetical protein